MAGRKRSASNSSNNPPSKKLKEVFGFLFWLIFFCSPVFSTNIDPLSMRALYSSSESVPSVSSSIARVRKPAPDFSAEGVVNGEFTNVKLSDYNGKYLVLFFYPLDFTFVCPTEIIAFSDRVDEFRKLDCEVAAISVDSKYTHLAWINTPRKEGGLGEMKIPLISDITKKISRDYGVLVEDGEDNGVALRGLFIINNEGIIRQITINDLPVGRSVDETLRLVQAFQYADKHPGQVCPANWKPGSLSMISDPQKAKEYFQKNF